MNCRNYLLFLLLLGSTSLFGQDEPDTLKLPVLPPPAPDSGWCMTEYALEVYFNKSFATIATGQSKTSDLANYAAFDPTKGAFTLNGFVAFAKKIKNGAPDDSSRSFLSFSLEGGLLNSNSTVLFQNAKLNTSVTLSAKYHIRLKDLGFKKPDNGICTLSVTVAKADQIRRLRNEDTVMEKSVDIKYDKKMTEYFLILLQQSDKVIPAQMSALKDQLKAILLQLQAPDTDGPLDPAVIDSLNKKAFALTKAVDSLGALSVNNQLKKDSVTSVLLHLNDSINAAKQRIRKSYQQKILQADLTTQLVSMHENWFTVITALNNQKYYTYFTALPFPQQINKNTFTTYSLGLQFNMYWQNLTEARKRRVDYLNFGLIRQRDNNTGDISSVTINQKTTTASNDTTREISTSYTAYTSPVVSFNEWNLFLNFYHLFGPTLFSGFHFYPNVLFRSNHQTLLNLGFGYVVSLPNKASGSPAVNAEVYFNFTDLTNSLHASTSVFQRGQLGILIGLPFNFLTK